MSPARTAPTTLDPDAPGLDEDTRQRRRVLAALQALPPEEVLQLAIRAGIYEHDGTLTAAYRNDDAAVVTAGRK